MDRSTPNAFLLNLGRSNVRRTLGVSSASMGEAWTNILTTAPQTRPRKGLVLFHAGGNALHSKGAPSAATLSWGNYKASIERSRSLEKHEMPGFERFEKIENIEEFDWIERAVGLKGSRVEGSTVRNAEYIGTSVPAL